MAQIREVPTAYAARELPASEWDKLRSLPIGVNLPDPSSAAILVVERDGEIIATWAALTAVHAEGCWIAEGYRRNPAVVQAFVAGFFQMLRAHGLSQVLTVTQTDDVGALASKLGAIPLGQLWLIPVPEE